MLVYSRTAGYRHDSIPAGIAALREIGAAGAGGRTAGGRFAVDATEDPAAFTGGGLAAYRVVIFLNTNGPVLDPAGRIALESFVRAGGGFVGVHSAAATEYDWPFYGGLVGAYFDRHPEVQPATIRVVDRTHPATAALPETWHRTDEWYDFHTDPRATARAGAAGVRVLMTVDESSYTGGGMGADHPIAWCREFAGGRSFYTAIGHTVAAYAEVGVRAHLAGGIRYAAGLPEYVDGLPGSGGRA